MKYKDLLFIFLLLACMGLGSPVWAQTGQGTPIDVYAAPGNGQAAVSFNVPPSSDTATPFTFTVKATGTDGSTSTAVGSYSPIVVSSLNNGISYSFTVTAADTNGAASTAASASNSVTPAAALYAAWAGAWNLNMIFAGAGAPYWNRCVEQLDGNGAFNTSCTDVNNNTGTNMGANFLFPYGMVPIISGANPFPNIVCLGSMNNTFNSCTGTMAGGSGTTFLMTGSLQATTQYSPSAAAGKWDFFSLDAGPDSPGWGEVSITTASNGVWSGLASNSGSNGKTVKIGGVVSLSPSGVLTCKSGDCPDPFFEGFMDAGKTTIAGVYGGGRRNPVKMPHLAFSPRRPLHAPWPTSPVFGEAIH